MSPTPPRSPRPTFDVSRPIGDAGCIQMDEPHGTDIPRSPLRISKPVPPLAAIPFRRHDSDASDGDGTSPSHSCASSFRSTLGIADDGLRNLSSRSGTSNSSQEEPRRLSAPGRISPKKPRLKASHRLNDSVSGSKDGKVSSLRLDRRRNRRLSSLQTGTVVKGDVVMPIATLVEPSQIIRRSSHPGLSTPLTLTSQSANWNDQQEFLEGSHSSHGSNPSTTGSRDASPPDVHDKDNEMVANQDFARRHSPFELREARDISSKGVTRDDSGSLLTLSVVQSHHASVPHAPGQRGSSRSPRPGPLNTSPRPPDVRDKDADKDTEVVAMRDLARRHSPLELQDISSKGVTREDSGSFLGISVVQSRRASAPHAPSQRASSRSPRPGPMYRSSSIHDSP
jgi:hypothetical protein